MRHDPTTDTPRPVEEETTVLARLPFAETLLQRYTPGFLQVSSRHELLYASERAAPYLQVRSGAPNLSILALVRPELEPALRRLLNGGARGDGKDVEFQGLLDDRDVRIVLRLEELKGGGFLVVLEDRLDLRSDRHVAGDIVPAPDDYVQSLERDLDEARDIIRGNVEDLETANEELKSSNEEMMSMNEELQSANEELSTKNEELQHKIAEVHEANADLANLIAATKIATVFLDKQLRLRSFTPEALNIYRFNEHDRDRPIEEVASRIDGTALLAMCRRVLDEGTAQVDRFEETSGDRVYRGQAMPYTTDRDANAGVVVTLTDITDYDRLARVAEENRHLAERRLVEVEEVFNASPIAKALFDRDLRYVRVNVRQAEINGRAIADHAGLRIDEVVPSLGDQIIAPVRQVFETGASVIDRRVEGVTPGTNGERRVWLCDWYAVHLDGDVVAVGLNTRDVTEQERMNGDLRRLMQELQHRVKNVLANVMALINRAARDAQSDPEALAKLVKRIQALAKTHSLLSNLGGGSMRVLAILEPELTEVYGTDRVTLRGPDVTVGPRTALALSMAVHELATNAAKYGCFSAVGGHLSLSWSRVDDGEDDAIVFTWTERGGPPAVRSGRIGFGSQLIRSTIEGSLGGELELSWEQDGLAAVITIPADHMHRSEERFADDIFAGTPSLPRG